MKGDVQLSEQLGSDIVEYSRKARFAGVSAEEWTERLTNLIAAQPNISKPIEVRNVRPVAAAAGGSNGTMLFDTTYTENEERKERSLVLRFLPAAGLFKTYDVRAQFELQRALESTDVPVPAQIWLDEDGEYLKKAGYVMEQVRGTSTPMNWKASGLLVDSPPDVRRKMSLGWVHGIATLHDVDWKAQGLEWLQSRGPGSRPMEREINWYWESLVWAERGEYIDRLAPIRDWLIANEPDDYRVVLCHGDANFGNYLYDDGELTAMVDWEMAFIGAPETDVCFGRIGDESLQGDMPPPEGALDYDDLYAEYERVSGHKLQHMPYFEMFASYRGAVISVLAMNHFPPEILEKLMWALERSVTLCEGRARSMRINC